MIKNNLININNTIDTDSLVIPNKIIDNHAYITNILKKWNIKFLFDIDGTLIDTENLQKEAWEIYFLLKNYIWKNNAKVPLYKEGTNSSEIIKSFYKLNEIEIDNDVLNREINIKEEIFRVLFENNRLKTTEGSFEFLKFLENSNICFGFVTSSYCKQLYASKSKTLKRLFNNNLYVSPNDVPHLNPKPSPDFYNYCYDQWGDDSIYFIFEDSNQGISAALNSYINKKVVFSVGKNSYSHAKQHSTILINDFKPLLCDSFWKQLDYCLKNEPNNLYS